MHLTTGQRLTLWYGAILIVSLAGLCVLVYTSFSRSLLSKTDRALDEELAEIEIEVINSHDSDVLNQQLEKYFGHHPYYDIQVARLDGSVLFQSERIGEQSLPIPDASDMGPGRVADSVLRPDGTRVRVASRLAQGFDGPLIMQAADSLEPMYANLGRLLATLLAAAPVVMGGALWGGYLLSRKALAPVDALTAAALRITASKLDERVAVGTPNDELTRLATAFNGMIERLERSFQQMQQFTADAAHELRTPLSVLRNEAEVALLSLRTPDEYRAVLTSQLEEVERLARLADQLLFLCREDSRAAPASDEAVALDQLVRDVAEQMQPAATRRGVRLEFAALPQCVAVSDSDRLRRLFANLIDNAIKYTPSGGKIVVSGARINGCIEVVVQDSGIGIPSLHLPRLFDRFYRADGARSGTEGTGLGLSICRAIVDSQNGDIDLQSTPGLGTTVRVRLPVNDREPRRPSRTSVPPPEAAATVPVP